MVRRTHPDANPGDPTTSAKFQAVHDAYQELIDPVKRQKLDLQIADEQRDREQYYSPPPQPSTPKPNRPARAPVSTQYATSAQPKRRTAPVTFSEMTNEEALEWLAHDLASLDDGIHLPKPSAVSVEVHPPLKLVTMLLWRYRQFTYGTLILLGGSLAIWRFGFFNTTQFAAAIALLATLLALARMAGRQ